jgi:cell division protein FtsQ
MRDYKNVKVPRKYRSGTTRATVKRVDTGSRQWTGKRASGPKNVVLTLLLWAVVAGGLWVTWQTYEIITHAEMFQIAGVDVKGVQELSDAELKSIVGPFTGQNIFRVDLEAAAGRARANPWIREIRIHRRLPNRISMTVTERVPYAVLESGAGRYLMDNEAVVIEPVSSARALPVIAIRDARPRPGEPVMLESLNEALTLLAEIELRGGWALADVTVKAASPEALSIVYADHEFKIGSGRYDQKLRRLAEVMADLKQRNLNIAYVDLRSEHQAAVMVKERAAGVDRQRGPDRIKKQR